MKTLHSILVALMALAVLGASSDAAAQGAPLVLDFNEVNVVEGGPMPQVGPFIEILNTGNGPQSLSNYRLITSDTNTIIELTDGVDLAAGDFWVVCGTSGLPVSNCDQMSADIDALLADPVLTLEFDLSSTWLQEDTITLGAGLIAADPTDRAGISTGADPLVTGGRQFSIQCPDPGEINSGEDGICGVLVNEIDYDQGDTDGARFVELAVYDETDIGCAELRFVDPGGTETRFIFPEDLPEPIAAGTYIVVCDDNTVTPNCDYQFSETDLGCGDSDSSFSDTGKHGVGFFANDRFSTRYDSMSYDGLVDGYTEGSMEAPSDISSPGLISVSRAPNAVDSQVNADDFSVVCATPGEANAADLTSCDLCGTGVVEGDEDCDEGGTENTATCDVDCTAPECNDGIFNALAEDCDPSDSDSPPCNDDCTLQGAFARGSGGCTASGAAGLGTFLVLLLMFGLTRRRRV